MTKIITWCDHVNLIFEIKFIKFIKFNKYIQILIFWVKLKMSSKDYYTKFIIPTTKKIFGWQFCFKLMIGCHDDVMIMTCPKSGWNF